MINNHTGLLNALIKKYNLESYCEIGLQNANNNFNKIECKIKCSVDPDPSANAMFDCTSDEFFKVNSNKFSIFFIDGYHECNQVKRDFENSLKCLNDSGFIVIHDVLPENEQGTKVPRETRQWWGDVYKFAMTMHDYGFEFKTFNIDNGCMVVSKAPIIRPIHPSNIKYDWETFKLYKKSLLRITDEVVI